MARTPANHAKLKAEEVVQQWKKMEDETRLNEKMKRKYNRDERDAWDRKYRNSLKGQEDRENKKEVYRKTVEEKRLKIADGKLMDYPRNAAAKDGMKMEVEVQPPPLGRVFRVNSVPIDIVKTLMVGLTDDKMKKVIEECGSRKIVKNSVQSNNDYPENHKEMKGNSYYYMFHWGNGKRDQKEADSGPKTFFTATYNNERLENNVVEALWRLGTMITKCLPEPVGSRTIANSPVVNGRVENLPDRYSRSSYYGGPAHGWIFHLGVLLNAGSGGKQMQELHLDNDLEMARRGEWDDLEEDSDSDDEDENDTHQIVRPPPIRYTPRAPFGRLQHFGGMHGQH